MNLELSDAELSLLREVVDATYRNLKEEISNTDSPFFKETLKAREATLLGLLEKLQSQVVK